MKTLDNDTYFSLVLDLLARGKSVRLRIRGESMTPFFPEGTVVTLHPCRPQDLRRGIPVLARTTRGDYVFHRILRCGDARLILQGDGNLQGTETALPTRVFARAECGTIHRTAALLWQTARPVRRYLLALYRRARSLARFVRCGSSRGR